MEHADIDAIRILATAYESIDSQNGAYARRKLDRAIRYLRNGFLHSKNRAYRGNRRLEVSNLWSI